MRRITAYLPALLWMFLIFMASTDAGSPRNTSRIIGPILRWFKPDVSDETVRKIQLAIRKTAHVGEYAILAALIWLGRRKDAGSWRDWVPREARLIVAFCAFYAITDEFHQKFVGSRNASPFDVGLDTVGAAIAIVMIWLFGRWRRIW